MNRMVNIFKVLPIVFYLWLINYEVLSSFFFCLILLSPITVVAFSHGFKCQKDPFIHKVMTFLQAQESGILLVQALKISNCISLPTRSLFLGQQLRDDQLRLGLILHFQLLLLSVPHSFSFPLSFFLFDINCCNSSIDKNISECKQIMFC